MNNMPEGHPVADPWDAIGHMMRHASADFIGQIVGYVEYLDGVVQIIVAAKRLNSKGTLNSDQHFFPSDVVVLDETFDFSGTLTRPEFKIGDLIRDELTCLAGKVIQVSVSVNHVTLYGVEPSAIDEDGLVVAAAAVPDYRAKHVDMVITERDLPDSERVGAIPV